MEQIRPTDPAASEARRPLRIDIVFPRVTEPFNGIGDHTSTLVQELASRGHSVRVIHDGQPGEAIGYSLVNGWPDGDLRDTRALVNAVSERASDAVLVQFEQFSYGPRGFNPRMAHLFADLRRASPSTRRVLFAHETYPDPDRPSKAVMWSYQRAQIRSLARDADTVLASCTKVFARLKDANPRTFPVPVHSNIPRQHLNRPEQRQRLGIADDELSVMVFGHLDSTRARWIAESFARVRRSAKAKLLYVGKAASVASELTGGDERRLVAIQNAAAEDVSAAMTASDLALAPFRDGVSGRRGSFAAYMEHQVPTLTNVGDLTDEYLRTAAATGAFGLAVDETDFFTRAEQFAVSTGALEAMRARIPNSFSYVPSRAATADAVEAACSG